MSPLLFWSQRAVKDEPWRIPYPFRAVSQATCIIIVQSFFWFFGGSEPLFGPHGRGIHLVKATLELHTKNIELGMPISLARRRHPFHRDLFTDVKNSDGSRLTEPVFAHRRVDGSFQLVYNTCPELDTHLQEKSGNPSYYGCIARVLSITAAGTQVGGEQTIDFRSILPESRVVGYWTPSKEPVSEDANVDDAMFAVWAAVCPSAAETCECAQNQCQLSLELHGVKSAFIEYATSSTYNVGKGERLCSGDDTGTNRLGRAPVGRFVYWLLEATGWVCGIADQHGAYVEFDEDHPGGTRVGSVFLLRKGKRAAVHEVTPILAGARLDYPFGFNALSVGKLGLTSGKGGSADDKHIAIVIRGRHFDEERKKTDPGCFAVAKSFTISATQTILNLPCRPCTFAEILSHPHLEELLPVCEELRNPRALFLNGQKVVQAIKTGRSETDYPEPLLPILIPDDFRSWNIVWRNTTYPPGVRSQSENGLNSILLHEWNQQLDVSSDGVELKRKASDSAPSQLYSAPFGKNSLLLAYREALSHTAVLEEIALDGRVVSDNSMKILGSMDGFLPPGYGGILMRAGEKVVTWYSLWGDSSLVADPVDPLTTLVRSTQRLRLVRVKEAEETRTACAGARATTADLLELRGKSQRQIVLDARVHSTVGTTLQFCLFSPNEDDRVYSLLFAAGLTSAGNLFPETEARFGPADTRCEESCHAFQSYQADTTTLTNVPSDCPFTNGVTFAEPCFDGGCSSVNIESVKAATSASAHFAPGESLKMRLRSIGPTPMLEIGLRNPSEIWSLRAYFVPHGRTEFNVSVLDQKQATIYTKSTKLSGHAHRGYLFWEWRDVLFFRAQYIRLEARAEWEAGAVLELADFQVKGRELPYCPPEGFFASESHGCSYRLDFLVKKSEIWDCQGHWSEWSYCDSTCRSTRFLTVEQHALYAGKPCLVFEKKPCSGGPLCNAINPTTLGGVRQSQDCIFKASEWSECRGCRRLRINHRAREASGTSKTPCPPVVETEKCGLPCDLEFERWKLRGNAIESRGVGVCDILYLTIAGTSFLVGMAATLAAARTARRP